MQNNKQSSRLLISFSGGKTSAYMTWLLLQNNDFSEKVVVFANTGKEKEETLEFVDKCDKVLGFNVVWVEAVVHHGIRKGTTHKVVTFETASMIGSPFEAVIQKYGIPNTAFPHCTRELKQNPIKSYAKNQLGWGSYTTAIGIRADEIDRINPDNIRNKKYWYPLADMGITQNNVNDFWKNNDFGFTLNLKAYEGNCDFCWKKTAAKLKKIASENPGVTKWWAEMEKKYGHIAKKEGVELPIVFGRQKLSIEQIILQSEENLPDLFNNYCGESCEPFN